MNKKSIFWTISSLLAIVGVMSIIWRLSAGMKMSALSSTIAWGMWVAFYIYFIGLSAGSFLLSTLIYVFGDTKLEKVGRMALLSALFALFGGLLFVWIDLGHPMRFWRVFLNWNSTSVLAWESMFYILYITIIGAELWFLMRCDLVLLISRSRGWRRTFYRIASLGYRFPEGSLDYAESRRQSMKAVKILGILGLPIALSVHGGTGALFAVVPARPHWFGPLFPIIFIVSALVSGAALTLFLYAFFGRETDEDYRSILRGIGNYLILFIGIDALLIASEFLTQLYPSLPEQTAVLNQVLFGEFWYTFWVGQLLLGMVLPVAIIVLKRNSPKWLGLAGLSSVVGIVAVRLNLVIPAFVVPLIEGLDSAYTDPRWVYHYFPSSGEWITSIGSIGLIVWGFALAWTLLPVYSSLDTQVNSEQA
jgi:Ni/Fe-hydrogenase subunit HybB-like protein